MNYYLAVAPCSFLLGGLHYKLSAGDTINLSNDLATQVASPSFKYTNHLKLISKSVDQETKEVKKAQDKVKEDDKEVKEDIKLEEKSTTKKSFPKVDIKTQDLK